MTDYSYDTRGNLTGIAYGDTSAEAFGHNPAGAVVSWQNRRGQEIQYTRNALGQITRKSYPDGRTIDFSYDARGFVTNIADSAQGATRFSYEARGFLASILYPDNRGFTFEYNAAGRRTRRLGHDGYTLNYGYDAAGRLLTLTEGAANELVRYSYDAASQLIRETKGNGTFTTYSYDLAGQVTGMTNYAPGGGVQSFFNYTYDAKGNRNSMTSAAGTTTYEYDAVCQLTAITYPGGRRVTIAYDAAGNRTITSDGGTNTTYVANGLNEYTQAGGVAMAYDLDGDLASWADGSGTTTYEYDVERRLVRVVSTNDIWQYSYDALGNRVLVVHNGVTNRYVHDPGGFVDVTAEYDGSGGLVARYDHGLGLAARTDGAGTAFYSFDALGNTRQLTGPAGVVLNAYDYDPLGAATSISESVPNACRFVGRLGVREDARGLHYMRARFYSAELGRFLSPDPLNLSGGDLNLYRYAGNNPVLWTDPEGNTLPLIVAGAAIGGIGGEAAYLIGQAVTGQEITLGGAVGSFASGAVFGGVAGATGGLSLLGGAALGGATGALGYGIQTGIDGGFTWGGLGLSTGLGVVFGGIGSKISNPLGEPKVWGVGGPGFLNTFLGQNLHGRSLWGGFLIGLPLDTLANILNNLFDTDSQIVRPVDPNDKLGPAGIGPNRVVSAQDEIKYIVRFENFTNASAPVQELVVVDYLDPSLDWTTVEFGNIAYGDRSINIHAGNLRFSTRDLPSPQSGSITGTTQGAMAIDASATFNPQTGRVEWRLKATDTATGMFPDDPLAGFLPPEDGTGRGNGHVTFRVKPRADVPIGTVITNKASIVFDTNDPIDTPPVRNMIGDVPSLSAVIAYLPGEITVGKPFSYTVAITNTGSTTVTNVVLTNTLPSSFNIANATATRGSVTVSGQNIIWNIGNATNAFGAVLTVTVVPTQGGTFTNGVFFSGGSGLAVFTAPTEITVLAPNGLRLDIRLVGNQIEVFWPTTFPGFQFQRASGLTGATSWTDVTNTPVVVGSEYRVNLGLPVNHEFYRLVKPSGTQTGPVLGIALQGQQVRLFWPTNDPSFALESATNLTATSIWSTVSPAPVVVNGQNVVTNNLTAGPRFYRLKKP